MKCQPQGQIIVWLIKPWSALELVEGDNKSTNVQMQYYILLDI